MGVNYGVLRGKVINSIPYKSGSDHFQIEIQADKPYRIAVDVYSQFAGGGIATPSLSGRALQTDRLVMYYKDEDFSHPLTTTFLSLPIGFTPRKSLPAALNLDYIRTQPALFPLDQLKIIAPVSQGQPGENLNGDIGPWINKATNNAQAEVFAFGSGWDDSAPGGTPDSRAYFHPDPKVGVHDIHMNQGDSGSEAQFNGTGQDGALFIFFKDTAQWIAMFFKFQNQSLHTGPDGNPVG